MQLYTFVSEKTAYGLSMGRVWVWYGCDMVRRARHQEPLEGEGRCAPDGKLTTPQVLLDAMRGKDLCSQVGCLGPWWQQRAQGTYPDAPLGRASQCLRR